MTADHRQELVERVGGMTQADIDRFWSKVVVGSADQCWLWRAAVNSRGYGTFRQNGRTLRAHRVAWELANEPIPDSRMVCHRCDTPPCCNPAHLFLGTARDNVIDMVTKGRNRRRASEEGVNFARGEDVGGSKLSATDVLTIRERRANGARPNDLAREYRVDRTLIWQIVTRKVWKHV